MATSSANNDKTDKKPAAPVKAARKPATKTAPKAAAPKPSAKPRATVKKAPVKKASPKKSPTAKTPAGTVSTGTVSTGAVSTEAVSTGKAPAVKVAQKKADSIATDIKAAGDTIAKVRTEIGKMIFGQQQVIDLTLNCILSGGHLLLMGVPGLAKTRLVDTLGTVLGLDARRVQCTPDLMPSDITGSEILDEAGGKRSFRFMPGPVFSQVLMADEINRASPRTQSALLQAMQEYKVTVAGEDHPLPQPFHVLATRNPLEQEGTYPLPEAQLDRFLMQINVGYPEADAERQMLLVTTGAKEEKPRAVLSAKKLRDLQNLVRVMPVGEQVVEGILKMVRNGRPEDTTLKTVKTAVAWGPGPRASQALLMTAKARALMDGRLSPSLDDVVALASPVLRHRMALGFAARAEGVTLDDILQKLCKSVG